MMLSVPTLFLFFFFFLMIRRPPRSTLDRSSAASDVYKRQRLMRSSILEVVNLDYIRTAKAKGLSPAQIFFSHQLRNAVLPVITYLGPSIAAVTTGGFVV